MISQEVAILWGGRWFPQNRRVTSISGRLRLASFLVTLFPPHELLDGRGRCRIIGENYRQWLGADCLVAFASRHDFDRTTARTVEQRHLAFGSFGPEVDQRLATVVESSLKNRVFYGGAVEQASLALVVIH